MNDKAYYTKNFEKRFGVKKNNFWLGFFNFFGIGDNPYLKVLKEISTRSDSQALQNDVNQLRNDCIKVVQDHHLETKPKNRMVDACQ